MQKEDVTLIEGFKYMSGVHPITYTHTPKAPSSFLLQKLFVGCGVAAHRLGSISQVVVIEVKRSHLPGKKSINDISKNPQIQQPT
jgi:peptide deformylase